VSSLNCDSSMQRLGSSPLGVCDWFSFSRGSLAWKLGTAVCRRLPTLPNSQVSQVKFTN